MGNIGLFLVLASSICFIAIWIYIILRRITAKNNYRKRCNEQEKIKHDRLLPIYYLSRARIKLVMFLTSILLIAILFFLILPIEVAIIVAIISLAFILVVPILYFLNVDISNGLFFIKEEMSKQYEIIEDNLSANARVISQRDYELRTTYSNREKCKFKAFSTSNGFNIGTIKLTWEIRGYRGRIPRGRIPISQSNIYIEKSLTHEMNEKIFLFNKVYYESINESNSIVPMYNILPPILFENCSLEYVKKIMNDDMQKCISDLAKRVKKYSIVFSNNKLTFIIHDACWSSTFSRIFMKNKCKANVLYSVGEIIDGLNKIEENLYNEN